MSWVASLYRAHREELAATLRETFQVSAWDIGQGVSWGEAVALIRAAGGDPSTRLGAVLAGWSYRASEPDLLALAAAVGEDRFKKIAPWVTTPKQAEKPTEREVEQALADLDNEIHFN